MCFYTRASEITSPFCATALEKKRNQPFLLAWPVVLLVSLHFSGPTSYPFCHVISPPWLCSVNTYHYFTGVCLRFFSSHISYNLFYCNLTFFVTKTYSTYLVSRQCGTIPEMDVTLLKSRQLIYTHKFFFQSSLYRM